MKHITVIGAGLMGQGIAQLFAASGHKVVLHDVSQESLQRAQLNIDKICEQMESPAGTAARITVSTNLIEAVGEADLVVEAVSEKLEIKQAIFAALDAHSPSHAVLASNTSVIPITRIAEPVTDKSRVMGMHFWNPPYLVPLVEVVEIEQTSPQRRDEMVDLLASVGQEPVVVHRDIPGFIGNRLQHALKREAIALVANGVCDAETVDKVIKLGFGSRLGVLGTLEQSDMVGLNLTLDIHNVIISDLDVSPGPHPYLEHLVSEGNLGMKTGKGFYEWTDEKAAAVRNRLSTYLNEQRTKRPQRTAK